LRICLVAKPIASPLQPPETHRVLYGERCYLDFPSAYEELVY
jgi:hypothetical protein